MTSITAASPTLSGYKDSYPAEAYEYNPKTQDETVFEDSSALNIEIEFTNEDFELFTEYHRREYKLSINHSADTSMQPLVFKYYPYSFLVSVVISVLSLTSILLFFLGKHSNLFISFWFLLIGLGMARTLVVASSERSKEDE